MSKIKICGLFRDNDIAYVNEYKPDFAGFIIDFPKSHRSIDVDRAKELIAKLDSGIKSVCVFVNAPLETVLECATFCDCVQLHGSEDSDFIDEIRKKSPNTCIIASFNIKNESDILRAKKSNADLIILDNGYGTGAQFDWGLIRDIGRDFMIAGGIDASTILAVIEQFNPYGIDISSGVETEKVKDKEKIKKILEIIQ